MDTRVHQVLQKVLVVNSAAPSPVTRSKAHVYSHIIIRAIESHTKTVLTQLIIKSVHCAHFLRRSCSCIAVKRNRVFSGTNNLFDYSIFRGLTQISKKHIISVNPCEQRQLKDKLIIQDRSTAALSPDVLNYSTNKVLVSVCTAGFVQIQTAKKQQLPADLKAVSHRHHVHVLHVIWMKVGHTWIYVEELRKLWSLREIFTYLFNFYE